MYRSQDPNRQDISTIAVGMDLLVLARQMALEGAGRPHRDRVEDNAFSRDHKTHSDTEKHEHDGDGHLSDNNAPSTSLPGASVHVDIGQISAGPRGITVGPEISSAHIEIGQQGLVGWGTPASLNGLLNAISELPSQWIMRLESPAAAYNLQNLHPVLGGQANPHLLESSFSVTTDDSHSTASSHSSLQGAQLSTSVLSLPLAGAGHDEREPQSHVTQAFTSGGVNTSHSSSQIGSSQQALNSLLATDNPPHISKSLFVSDPTSDLSSTRMTNITAPTLLEAASISTSPALSGPSHAGAVPPADPAPTSPVLADPSHAGAVPPADPAPASPVATDPAPTSPVLADPGPADPSHAGAVPPADPAPASPVATDPAHATIGGVISADSAEVIHAPSGSLAFTDSVPAPIPPNFSDLARAASRPEATSPETAIPAQVIERTQPFGFQAGVAHDYPHAPNSQLTPTSNPEAVADLRSRLVVLSNPAIKEDTLHASGPHGPETRGFADHRLVLIDYMLDGEGKVHQSSDATYDVAHEIVYGSPGHGVSAELASSLLDFMTKLSPDAHDRLHTAPLQDSLTLSHTVEHQDVLTTSGEHASFMPGQDHLHDLNIHHNNMSNHAGLEELIIVQHLDIHQG